MSKSDTQNLETIVDTAIDAKLRSTWRWPSTTIAVPRRSLVEFSPIQNPSFGDLALCQVVSVGANTFIENSVGCNMSIFPGTVFVGCFAPRYALDEFEGSVPSVIDEDSEIALLNRGGTIGEVLSRNSNHKAPTIIKVLSFFKDRHGRVANLKNFGKRSSSNPFTEPSDRTLIVVVGTSMNSGKSSTAKAITYALTASGHNVVAAKATGQGARRDVLLMKAAGATHICDFTDFGYPSTYLLEQDEMKRLFWKIYNDLYARAGAGGFMVIELADGILQRETAMLLRDPLVRQRIGHLVFSCCDSLSAVAGVEALRKQFGLETTAISGPAANSELGLKEVSQFLGAFPAFNNMIMDSKLISSFLSKPRPGGSAAMSVKSPQTIEKLVEKSDPLEFVYPMEQLPMTSEDFPV
jgi:hypothetical protein